MYIHIHTYIQEGGSVSAALLSPQAGRYNVDLSFAGRRGGGGGGGRGKGEREGCLDPRLQGLTMAADNLRLIDDMDVLSNSGTNLTQILITHR